MPITSRKERFERDEAFYFSVSLCETTGHSFKIW